MTDQEWLYKVKVAAAVYNDQRLCRDFQAEEIVEFVEFLYKEYGVEWKGW